jgi:hypothetical protein
MLASGIRKLPSHEAAGLAASRKGFPMSKTASVALAPSSSLFARLMAAIDSFLMASAEISNRNGQLPRFGL